MPYYRLFYHFIWTTKHRLPAIEGTARDLIYDKIRSQVTHLNSIVYALNGIADYIHLAVTVPPTMALSAFIKQIKGSSSRLASEYIDGFAWQTQYGV